MSLPCLSGSIYSSRACCDYGRVAVNAEFAEADTPLREGDEVAFLQPVSGG